MSQFTKPCRVEIVGPMLFALIEPFEYHVGRYPSNEIILVPEDFITDFASIPRVFWSILSPIDEYAKAAVLHDFMYVMAPYDRLRCEEIFLEAMTVLKVKEWKRNTIYNAVKWFGWKRWNELREEQECIEKKITKKR
jgi:hypothetical protein